MEKSADISRVEGYPVILNMTPNFRSESIPYPAKALNILYFSHPVSHLTQFGFKLLLARLHLRYRASLTGLTHVKGETEEVEGAVSVVRRAISSNLTVAFYPNNRSIKDLFSPRD